MSEGRDFRKSLWSLVGGSLTKQQRETDKLLSCQNLLGKQTAPGGRESLEALHSLCQRGEAGGPAKALALGLVLGPAPRRPKAAASGASRNS